MTCRCGNCDTAYRIVFYREFFFIADSHVSLTVLPVGLSRFITIKHITMTPAVHRVYILALFTLGIAISVIVGYEGIRYYGTTPAERGNLLADYDARISDIDVEIELMREGLGSMGKTEKELRHEQQHIRDESRYWEDWGSSGFVGHGLGITGSLMMLGGVALYSTRKRVKRFRFVGKIKHFLEFHIFLCLLGPTLVIFHSTFKFGGLVSVSLWSMIFVALSGIFGRYIYTQIPKTGEGDEVTLEDLTRENEVLRMRLKTQMHLSPQALDAIDAVSTLQPSARPRSVPRAIIALLRDDIKRASRLRAMKHLLMRENLPVDRVQHVVSIARSKSLLIRKIAFFDTARALFQYWHVIHLPFSIIMFIILVVHVALTVSLGYTWIF